MTASPVGLYPALPLYEMAAMVQAAAGAQMEPAYKWRIIARHFRKRLIQEAVKEEMDGAA